MGFGGGAKRAAPLVIPPPKKKPAEPIDPIALGEARARAEAAQNRRGKLKLRIQLNSVVAGFQSAIPGLQIS